MKSIWIFLLVIGNLALRAAPFTEVLPNPTRPGSQCSNLTAAPDGTLILTWSEPAETVDSTSGAPALRALRVATLPPGQRTWSAPRTIVATPRLMENWADFASLSVGTDGAWTAQWIQRDESTSGHGGYSGWVSRSSDRGETWRTPTPLGHEFVSLAPLSGGRTLVVWLESLRKGGHDHAAAPGAPSMQLRSTILAPDGTTAEPWIVDPDVCNCCQTTLVPLGQDRALVAYRGHTSEEIRDHRLAHFDGKQWKGSTPLHADGWKIAACPVNGPVAAAHSETTAVTWYTAAQGTPRVQLRFSPDRGTTWGAAFPIDLGRPMGRLELIMQSDGSAVVIWMEIGTAENAAGIYARRIFADGAHSEAHLIADSSQKRTSGFPRAAAPADGRIIVSWTQPGEPSQVQTRILDANALGRATAAVPSTSK